MKLASRMTGIGTETAFEAAARARALEATGHHVFHLDLGSKNGDRLLLVEAPQPPPGRDSSSSR
jgi:hypothetical protein